MIPYDTHYGSYTTMLTKKTLKWLAVIIFLVSAYPRDTRGNLEMCANC